MTQFPLLIAAKKSLAALCGILIASAVVMPPRAAANDFRFSFNQNPVDVWGTLLPDGSSTLTWVTQDGQQRPAGDYEVEGLVQGLVDGMSNQVPPTIVLTKASHDPLSVGTYRFSQGKGFEVQAGEISRAYWIGELESTGIVRRLILNPTYTILTPFWGKLISGPLDSSISFDEEGHEFWNCACYINAGPPVGSSLLFTALAPSNNGPLTSPLLSVPGPLPLLAIAVAYRSSRRLRRRIPRAI